MKDRRPSTGGVRWHASLVLTGVLLALLPPAAPAQAPPPPPTPLPLPPGATPGGALPQPLPRAPLPAAPDTGIFPIPPTVERPLGVEEGERVFVERFKLKGVVDRPEQGISAAELREIIERLRIDRQGLNEVGEHGFTPGEQAQIAAFMSQVVANRDLDMMFEDYQALVDTLRAEKRKRTAGLTIGQLQELANTVTQYYRSAGFILAQAYVPAQEVVDGEVVIEVLEGRLGNVLAEGNESYPNDVLVEPFEELIDAPVTAESIESSILTVTDYPGLTVSGVFRPGRTVGTSDLLLLVQDEKPVDATLRFDNFGTRFTGERRVFADFTLNNPTKSGDRATASLLQQYMPKNSLFYSLEYVRPIIAPGIALGASFSKNSFDVGAEFRDLGLSGISQIASVYAERSFQRSRAENLSGRVGVSRKRAQTRQNSVVISQDDLSMLEAEVSFDDIDKAARAINTGTVGFSRGLGDILGGMGRDRIQSQTPPPSRQGGTTKFASNEFLKFYGNYSRLQTITENNTVLVRLNGQYSNSLLTSLEQFDIGGPNSVRAYPLTEFLADSGLFASMEWNINAPGFADAQAFDNLTWGEVLRVSFFTDWATGYNNDPIGVQEDQVTVAGYGMGVLFNIPGTLSARIQAARRLGGREASDRDDTQYWFDFTYTF